MAKKKNQNPIDALNAADEKHYRDTERYVKVVESLYKDAISEISQLAAKVGAIPATDQFSFSKNPAISQQVDGVIQKLASKFQAVIETGDRQQWDAACAKSVSFLNSIMRTSALPKPLLQTYQDRNLEALAAFQERKINGLGLSERVWKYVSPLKQEIETVADTSKAYINNGINTPDAMEKVERALGTGLSADDLSREVRACLKEPNKLFRRVRDKYGNLQLSKNAKLYHPGQGVYRSSYKNAKRMTRSEINMAYRQSDYLRWQQLDFVVGLRVQLSQNHTCLGKDGKPHPFFDICDILQGDYPKDAKLVGWHPQCKCIITPIMKPYDEWNQDRAYLNAKAYKQLPASNEVTDVPKGFKDYIRENQKRIAGWTSTPYYIKDNPHFFDKAINPGKYSGKRLILNADESNLLKDYRMYGFNHQGSSKFALALDDALKAYMSGDRSAFDTAMTSMDFIKRTNERVKEYTAMKRAMEELYVVLKAHSSYVDVQYNPKTGGLKATHKDHTFDPAKGKYEKSARDAGFASGHVVILEKEKSTTIGQKFSEGLWDGRKFEVMGCETASKNNYLRGLKHANSKPDAKIAVLEFPNGGFSEEMIEEALRIYKGLIKSDPDNFRELERIVCVQDGKVVYDQPFKKSTGGSESLQYTPRTAKIEDINNLTKKLSSEIGLDDSKLRHLKSKVTKKTIDPAQERHKYDDQIAMLKKNAQRYGLDVNAIDEAFASLDLKKLQRVIDEQQKILDEGMAKKKKIWDAADKRHAARTPEKEAALKDFIKEHKAKTESVYKQVDEAIANAKGINEADVSILKDLKSGKAGSYTTKAGKTVITSVEKLQKEAQKLEKIVEEYNTAMNEAKALVSELKGISDVDTETVLKSTSIKGVKDGIKKLQETKEKIAKLNTLDNPLQVAKDYSLADAVATHNAVVKKVKEWETKYSTDSYLQKTTTQNEYLAKKLKYEINEHFGKESVQQKYKTWAVAQSAYAKKLVAVEKEIWASKASEKLAEIEAFSKAHPTSKILANKFAEAQKALLDKDQTLFEQCYTEAQLKDKALNKRAKKKVPEGDVVFNESCFSKERKTKAKQFHTDESSQEYFYNNARENYANADRGTRQAAENYTHNSGYLTKPARALSGFYEREASYAAKAAKDMQLLTDYIRQSSFEHDVWVSREERMAFLVLKTGGLDGDTLMKNVEEYAKKARVKYKGKKTKAEIDALIKRYKKHEESQMIGRKGVDPSIVSTSANLDQRFSGTGGDNKYGKPKVHLEIFCPKGTQAVYADPYSHYTHSVKGPDGFWDAKTKPSNTSENEIFLQQHTEYRILEARYVESEDKWYVKAEVVAQRPRNVKGYVYDADEGGYKLDFE